MSRSWSSGIGCISSSAAAWSAPARAAASKASSRAACAAFRANEAARRARSIARLRAVVVIHAPGFAGTPSDGHRSSAAT